MENKNYECSIEDVNVIDDKELAEEMRKRRMIEELSLMSKEEIIASVFHHANKKWQAANGNLDIKSWHLLKQYEKDSRIDAVKEAMRNRNEIDSTEYYRYSYVEQVEHKLFYAIVDALK